MIDSGRKHGFPFLSTLTFTLALTFEVMICCYLDGVGPVKMTYSLVALVFLAIIAIWKLKTALYAPTSPIQSLGRTVLMITAFSASGLLIAFYLLLSLKVDQVWIKDCSYAIVFIPIYTFLFISAFFICFIFPGLVDPSIRAYREACLLLTYYVSIIVSVFLLINKLDSHDQENDAADDVATATKNHDNSNKEFTKVFLPLWIVFGFHFLTIMVAILKKADSSPHRHFHPEGFGNTTSTQFPAQELCFLLLLATQALLINLKLIGSFPLNSWILMVPTFVLTLYLGALLQVSTILSPRTKRDANMSGFDPDDIFLEEGNTRDDL
mmetsp:Transcript_33293/g.37819  ORF Transcript_33293/g.37819 Transcript_33293/m.37819 type:complete len:324 (-) Transcript_33293:469-1440(-)|eukprot:CAMPEP_0115015380 /NCGR_PEP_ID=MMETSP0216-20121206/26736_1 /TAXON_ID=223996 /ORGANISM="Protocruzia adherens, Strain Boccale" /LENGTH=323 /DNA_ID=CAMNT_0002385493 /DNA_START=575 /DNA_END=1546 /DNA_ORIENTATION=+